MIIGRIYLLARLLVKRCPVKVQPIMVEGNGRNNKGQHTADQNSPAAY